MHNEPAFLITRFKPAPFFVFADHASNRIPADLDGLGLGEKTLNTHIAWDIGAGALALAMGERLGGSVLRANFSRLLIDPNRDPDAPDLIPPISDETVIPGNQALGESGRQARMDRFYDPYHDGLNSAIDHMCAQHETLFIVSIHSFTKRMKGANRDRPWQAGLLWSGDEPSARLAIDHLAQKAGWTVGDNEPYDGRLYNRTLARHVEPRGTPHLNFEIRQDLIDTEAGVTRVCEILSAAVKAAAKIVAKTVIGAARKP